MASSKNAQPGVTDITWALMAKWAAAYELPVKELYREHFKWAVKMAKAYHRKASPTVNERQFGAFL